MKATYISREKNDVKFTMEFTAEEFDNAQIKAYQAAKGNIEIPGFRRGKALPEHRRRILILPQPVIRAIRRHRQPGSLRLPPKIGSPLRIAGKHMGVF